MAGPAQLFYDPSCGPCTLFARACEWASRSQLRSMPYDGPEAGRLLSDLDPTTRFSYAHLVDASGRTTGREILPGLVHRILGHALGRAVVRAPPIERGLGWTYDRFWEYRRTHGCAAGERLPV